MNNGTTKANREDETEAAVLNLWLLPLHWKQTCLLERVASTSVSLLHLGHVGDWDPFVYSLHYNMEAVRSTCSHSTHNTRAIVPLKRERHMEITWQVTEWWIHQRQSDWANCESRHNIQHINTYVCASPPLWGLEEQLQETMKCEQQRQRRWGGWGGVCQFSCFALLPHIIGDFLFKVPLNFPRRWGSKVKSLGAVHTVKQTHRSFFWISAQCCLFFFSPADKDVTSSRI